MKNRIIVILCFSVFSFSALQGEILWKADFQTDELGKKPSVSSSGKNDTFSGVVFPDDGALKNDGAVVEAVPGFASGKVLRIKASGTAGKIANEFKQLQLKSVKNGEVFVLSFDNQRPVYPTMSAYSVVVYQTGGKHVSGGTANINFMGGTCTREAAVRTTVIVNKTDKSITLPSGMGVVAPGQLVGYFKKQGGTYHLAKGPEVDYSDIDVGGFKLLVHLKDAESIMYVDNMIVCNSIEDTVGGKNILELDFGTVCAMETP